MQQPMRPLNALEARPLALVLPSGPERRARAAWRPKWAEAAKVGLEADAACTKSPMPLRLAIQVPRRRAVAEALQTSRRRGTHTPRDA